ncbi:hypothetical protein K501DRAFT_279384 [Backusella circina FSU 941]|nr:hypothetical protein K501DRAFT_279384 [Backusella circina FSU 941]
MKWSFVCEKKIRVSLDNEEDIQELRKSCHSLTSLGKEKGVKTDAKNKSGFGSGELNKFFSRKPASEKKAFECWNKYAEDNFDRLLQEIKNEDQTNSAPSGSTASVQASSASSGSTVSGQASSIPSDNTIQQTKEGHERQLKNTKRAEKVQERIRTCPEVLDKEVDIILVTPQDLVSDEDEDSSDVDFSRSRLRTLRNIMRQLLYKHHGIAVKERHLKDALSDIQPCEIRVCLLIINTNMPYVPKKESFFIIAHQTPFFLMANQILNSTKYSKFSSPISLIPAPNGLHALKVDAPSLLSIWDIHLVKVKFNIKEYQLLNFIGIMGLIYDLHCELG